LIDGSVRFMPKRKGKKPDSIYCKYCGQFGKPAESHVIPEAYYRMLKTERPDESLLILDRLARRPIGETRIGFYDYNLLCTSCEVIFSGWDDYGFKALSKPWTDSRYILKGGRQTAYLLESYDYSKMKLFILSVVWRILASGRPIYSEIHSESAENELKKCLQTNDPRGIDDFSVHISRFKGADLPDLMLFQPILEELDGVVYCKFYLLDYRIRVKLNDVSLPKINHPYLLGPHNRGRVYLLDFWKSVEWESIQEMLTTNRVI